jgi:hypothetical protein
MGEIVMWGNCARTFAAIGITTLASSQCFAADDSFQNFQAAYRCDIMERLKLIQATGNPARPLNRYLAISTPTRNYVQCIFQEGNSYVHCEASSGFWAMKRGRERTVYQTPRAIAALASLGFDTDDSVGNFRIEHPTATPADFASLTDLMLRALHDGYGARSDTVLVFNAPFAPYRPAACVPIS